MDNSIPLLPEAVIAIIILLVTFIAYIKSNIQEISWEIIQTATDSTRKISHNKHLRGTIEIYRKTLEAISDVTRPTIRPGINREKQQQYTKWDQHAKTL